MRGAVPPLTQYVFMTWCAGTVPVPLPLSVTCLQCWHWIKDVRADMTSQLRGLCYSFYPMKNTLHFIRQKLRRFYPANLYN